MSGPVMPDGAGRSMDEPARARRRAGISTFQTVSVLTMGAVVALNWWSAQVNHFSGTRNRGFVEGDSFPWFLVLPILVLGLWLAARTIAQWVHYTAMTRSGARSWRTNGDARHHKGRVRFDRSPK